MQFHNSDDVSKQTELILSFRAVRQTIGALGFLLPALLLLMTAFDAVVFVPSISEFYFTPAREILVANVGAIAVFLFSYKGYGIDPTRAEGDWWERNITDRFVARAAAIGALGVAFFPTSIETACKLEALVCATTDGNAQVVTSMEPDALSLVLLAPFPVTLLHAASALLFFVALATFCLSNFQRGRLAGEARTGEDWIYTICGWAIVVCTIAIIIFFVINSDFGSQSLSEQVQGNRLTFWAESIGLVAFSISWLTKGQLRQSVMERMGRD